MAVKIKICSRSEGVINQTLEELEKAGAIIEGIDPLPSPEVMITYSLIEIEKE